MLTGVQVAGYRGMSDGGYQVVNNGGPDGG